MKTLSKILSHTLPFLFICSTALATPSVNSIPTTSGKDLNGKPWTVPDGLPGNRSLVLLGFDEPQQASIDTWTEGLHLTAPNNTIAWIEMPLIDNPGIFMRWFINTGMRGGIPSKEVRSHVWTAYTDKKFFLKSCGITSEKEIYALVVDRQGNILSVEKGDFNKEAGNRVLRAIKG